MGVHPKPDAPFSKKGRPTTQLRTPQAPAGVPQMPEFVTGAKAKRYWEYYVELLTQMPGVLTIADGDPLGTLCMQRVRWEDLSRAVRKEGEIVPGFGGVPAKNPRVAIMQEAERAFLRSLDKFGLSPVARSRMQINKPDQNANASKMLSLINSAKVG